MSVCSVGSESADHTDAFDCAASLNKITFLLLLGDLGFLDLAGERSNLFEGRFQFLLERFNGCTQIIQRQKERDFVQAKRAIERIRMVSGF